MENVTVLNVGHGDTKLTFDPKKPADRKRTARIVGEMLKLGFAICVRKGDRWVRASGFDPEKTEYLIKESPRGRMKGVPAKLDAHRVHAESSTAVSVARSAGGMSTQADSVEVQNLQQFDKLRGIRTALRKLADDEDEWAGIPMPLSDQPLVMDPKYKLAQAFALEPNEIEIGVTLRNGFYSRRLRTNVLIWNEPDGRIAWCCDGPSATALQIQTLGASAAWGIEQEHAALETLAELVGHHTFKSYLLTGMFLETSPRSGVTYCFRKLRPTLALRPGTDGDMRILAALCMHPIAYYDGSWAGAMCPSDDVLAHLMLMRADEQFYWRRCNQHQPDRVEAGL